MADEIVTELRKVKDAIAKEFGCDVKAFVAHLQAKKREEDHRIIDLKSMKQAAEHRGAGSQRSRLWRLATTRQIIDGFGNHDPGSGRYNRLRSRWDTLHPGREWAFKCRQRPEAPEQIIEELRAYLLTAPNPTLG